MGIYFPIGTGENLNTTLCINGNGAARDRSNRTADLTYNLTLSLRFLTTDTGDVLARETFVLEE